MQITPNSKRYNIDEVSINPYVAIGGVFYPQMHLFYPVALKLLRIVTKTFVTYVGKCERGCCGSMATGCHGLHL